MKYIDQLLQNERIKKAVPWIRDNAVVLDIGCYNGALLQKIESRISYGYGIDPLLEHKIMKEKYILFPGKFPYDLPKELTSFDVITALAVFEHLSEEERPFFVQSIKQKLRPGGRIILTIPNKQVDHILKFLIKIKLIDGMSLEEHHGFETIKTFELFFQEGFILEQYNKFQLGLNNLYIFTI